MPAARRAGTLAGIEGGTMFAMLMPLLAALMITVPALARAAIDGWIETAVQALVER